VKYAQCVKIWLFLKSCVQFLLDIILNLAIVLFLKKKKGDACSLHASRIGGNGRHAIQMVGHPFT
jgi:hypothetical protein